MSLGKKLFLGGTPGPCTTDTVDKFADSSGVALYSLDYDASDASGNYDGTPSNVTFGVDGQINWGASFNGSSSYIQTSLSQNSDNIAISFWMQADATGGTSPILMINNRNGVIVPYAYGTGSNSITANTGNQNILLNSTTLTSQWNHIVINMTGWASSYTASAFGGSINMEVFVNGSSIGTTTNKPYGLSTGARLGRSNGSYYFTGKLDQVRMFNKALSSSEISTLYAETACVYTSTTDVVGFPSTAASNLFAYYKLNNSGLDETGNHDGTQGSSTAYSFGRFGVGGDFDGSNNAVITIPDSNKFSPSVNDFSVSFWFNVSNASTNRMVAKGSNPYEWEIWISNGQPVYVSYNSPGSGHGVLYGGPSPGAYSDGNWHHMVVTHDHLTKIEMFVDNTSIGTLTTFSGSMSNTNSTVTIGKRGDQSTSMIGRLDQFRFYDKILTTNEIGELYNEKQEANTSNFETVLWSGNGGSQYISSLGFEPDFVWIKKRGNDTKDHRLFDTVRGPNKVIYSSRDLPEGSPTTELTSFEANGFMLGSGSAVNDADTNDSYVAWCWKAGGDAVNNTDGNITSQVSVNQNAGFSIVKWTSTGSGNSTKTVGHGLSSAPDMIILKNASATSSWRVYHSGIPSPNNSLALNSDEIAFSFWPSVSSTNFGLVASVTTGESSGASGQSMIAYCLHSVTGYQKMGVYTGNSNNSGPIITTGFRPRFVMVKGSSINKSWRVQDDKRGYSSSTGVVESQLEWNTSSIEGTGADRVKFTNTGFQIVTSSAGWNSSGQQYIYLAIA